MKKGSIALLAVTFLTAGFLSPALADTSRDYISIVGSSTVYPFSTVVAEKFGKSAGFKTPKIESTGTGGGFKLFCSGIGAEFPDMANASRAIKKSECESCVKNGVTEIVEVKIGYDGISIANSKTAPRINLTRRDLFLALAKEIPEKEGDKLIPNPHKTWKSVNPTLPDSAIEVLGPPPTSGTRDAFLELAMEEGGQTFEWLKALKKSDEKKFKSICHTIREDGAYIEAGENDNLIVQKLVANPKAVGIFGYSFLEQNEDKVQGASIEGVQPTFETIASGSYSISRPLFFYVKKVHANVIPGIREYLQELTSEKAWGKEGYLSEKGLIPMPESERKKVREDVTAMKLHPMK